MVPEVVAAIQDPQTHSELETSISRERVGVELMKMMEGPRCFESLILIHQLHLFDSIVSLPSEVAFNIQEPVLAAHNRPDDPATPLIDEKDSLTGAKHLFKKPKYTQLMSLADKSMHSVCSLYSLEAHPPLQDLLSLSSYSNQITSKDLRLMYATSFLFPFRNSMLQPSISRSKKPIPLSTFIVKERMQWPSLDAEVIFALHNLVDVVLEAVEKIKNVSLDLPIDFEHRKTLSRLIRKCSLSPLNHRYPLAILFALSTVLSPQSVPLVIDLFRYDERKMADDGKGLTDTPTPFQHLTIPRVSVSAPSDSTVDSFRHLFLLVNHLNYQHLHTHKCAVNGKHVISLPMFEGRRSGAWLSRVLESVFEYEVVFLWDVVEKDRLALCLSWIESQKWNLA